MGEHEEHHGDSHEMHDPRRMIVQMRRKWLWTNWVIIGLGVWLMTSPFTFGYERATMVWSDVISGAGLVLFAGIALYPSPRTDFWGRWIVAFIGVWLNFAPLVFWAGSPVAYATDTLIGALVIGLSILVPMMPGMAHHRAMMRPGPQIPPGWTYNPSSWQQRAPLIALALLGWFVSRYLAAGQLGYVHSVWEPFFGDGTLRVLHSKVSQMWPISDAGLGAFAYTFEALMGFMGMKSRWRTMPWMVLFFGILVVPLGLTHIVLVILQPVVVGEWCTLCLLAAAIMLLMIPLAVDEVVAMLQFMADAKHEGKPLWWTFWVGDTMAGGAQDKRSPPYGSPIAPQVPAMVWGMSVPWTLLLSAALGVWLMAAPAVLGTTGAAAHSNNLIGALVVTVSVIVMAEVLRAGRFLNVLAGLWIIIAPWVLQGATMEAQWSNLLVGAALVVLALPRGPVREHYGSWDRFVV